MKNELLQKLFIAAMAAILSVLATLAGTAGTTISRTEATAMVNAAKVDAADRAEALGVKLDAIQAAMWAMKVDLERQRTLLEDISKTHGGRQ